MTNSNFHIKSEFLITKDGLHYIHRDVSWLSFNYRVLQEAMDTNTPLMERIKFLAIYSSNLDEFFKVRMAYHRFMLRANKKTRKELEINPKTVIKEIQRIVNYQQKEFVRIFESSILPALKNKGIYLLRRKELTSEQLTYIENYFNDHMLPFVQPVLLVKNKIRPFLSNAALYLSIMMRDREDSNGAAQYALVKIPSDHLPRFIPLPNATPGRKEIILLDDIVRHNISFMFPGYSILDSFSIKLTRDAELYIEDEFSGDLLSKIKDSLIKRQVGLPSRFVYDRTMPDELLQLLMETFELNTYDTLREGRYHNNFDFFKFPDMGLDRYESQPPNPYDPLETVKDIFAAIKERDHLIHVPYQSYESLIRLIEEAAFDTKVTHIKIMLYRVAKKSRIIDALLNAAEMGKHVMVFIEVKARFDEEANLKWGEKLQKNNIQVIYSLPGIKVHSKLLLIRRKEGRGFRHFGFLSTGNFNEDTAKIYCDYGLFTTDLGLVDEMVSIFKHVETGQTLTTDFKHILVGQYNLRSELIQLIDFEIEQAKNGQPAEIILKMNSIQDRAMVEKLYEAGKAGVRIKLMVRGICCVVPGIQNLSHNIEAISIVDRYLEHARVFYFYAGGKEKIYLSSADWMVRNLTFRIETAFPVTDPALKEEIIDNLQIQWSDNVKARILDEKLSNRYRDNGSQELIRSQEELYRYYRKKRLETKPKPDKRKGNLS